jgi:hypothetical protein
MALAWQDLEQMLRLMFAMCVLVSHSIELVDGNGCASRWAFIWHPVAWR